MPRQIIRKDTTSYSKIGGKYEVVSVISQGMLLEEGEDIPVNEWINEYLEVEYFYTDDVEEE